MSFFFNATSTTKIYTLSLHDALPISRISCTLRRSAPPSSRWVAALWRRPCGPVSRLLEGRSEEHTSELQSRRDLVCRLLLEKKKSHRGRREVPGLHPH